MEIFSRVYMELKTGKKLYLVAGVGKSCKWGDKENAIWFDTEKEALDFCNGYFKNFRDFKVENFEYSI